MLEVVVWRREREEGWKRSLSLPTQSLSLSPRKRRKDKKVNLVEDTREGEEFLGIWTLGK